MLVNDLTDTHFSDLLDVHGSQNLQQNAHVVNSLKTGLNAEVNRVGGGGGGNFSGRKHHRRTIVNHGHKPFVCQKPKTYFLKNLR